MIEDDRLSVVLTGPTGEQVRFDSANAKPELVPLDLNFSTSLEGFTTGSFRLVRDPSVSRFDMSLLDTVQFISSSGAVAYEGRIQSVPSSRSVLVQTEGWMSHARQRTLTDFLIDRDPANWKDSGNDLKALYASISSIRPVTGPSASDETFEMRLDRVAQATSNGPRVVALYEAPSEIGSVSMVVTAPTSLASPWRLQTFAATDRIGSNAAGNTTLSPIGTSQTRSILPTDADSCRFAFAQFFHAGALTSDAGFSVYVAPTVLARSRPSTTITRDDGTTGFAASEVIKWLAAKYAPRLDTSGVQRTYYGIPQIRWDSPITCDDAMKQVNAFHSWQLAVWENRQLSYAPFDFTSADWLVREGENGVTVESTGDTTESIFNGCAVSYTDFDGNPQRLLPTDTSVLRDESSWIAANRWNDQAWFDIELSWKASADDAALIGSIALAEANRAQRPSTIEVPRQILDQHGTWQPCWKVRAGDTISVMDQGSTSPRLITETSWQNGVLRITTDNAVDSLAVVQQRIISALGVGGLT